MSRSPHTPILAPSILSADFARLERELRWAEQARGWIHCDVMDAHFVPNLSFGALIVDAVRRLTSFHLDVHLMVERPLELLEGFVAAGANGVIVHLEVCHDPPSALRQVRGAGVQAGLALKPATPFESAQPYLADLDQLLVMTVEPGFGGQAFMAEMLPKIRQAAEWRASHGLSYRIEVDGGIAPDTAGPCREAGADVFVAGHSYFRPADRQAALSGLRRALGLA